MHLEKKVSFVFFMSTKTIPSLQTHSTLVLDTSPSLHDFPGAHSLPTAVQRSPHPLATASLLEELWLEDHYLGGTVRLVWVVATM